MITMFLGKPISYWIELQRQADMLNVTHLLEENAMLRAKVNKYEEVFDQLRTFQDHLK